MRFWKFGEKTLKIITSHLNPHAKYSDVVCIKNLVTFYLDLIVPDFDSKKAINKLKLNFFSLKDFRIKIIYKKIKSFFM